MKLQYTSICLFAVVLLVVSSLGLASPEEDRNAEITETGPPTTLKKDTISPTSDTDLAPLTLKTIPTISTTTAVNDQSSKSFTVAAPASTTSSPTNTTSTSAELSTVSVTVTPPPASSTTSIIITVTQPVTTTSPPARKFDGLSFLGGMILVVGLGALVYLVLRYLRRTNRLPYSNLR